MANDEPRVRLLEAKLDTPDVASLTQELVQVLGRASIEKQIKRMHRSLATERGIYRDHWVIPTTRWWAGLEYLMGVFSRGVPKTVELTRDSEWVLESALKLRTLLPGMPDTIRAQFAGRLAAARNVFPALLELNIAAHFWQTGREIKWFTHTGVAGQRVSEFAAIGGPGDIQVECKSKSLDAGRRVTQPAFYRMVDEINSHLKRHRLCGYVSVDLQGSMPVGRLWREQVIASLPRQPEEASRSGPENCLISWRLFWGDQIVLSGVRGPDEIAAPHLEAFAHVAVFAEAHPAGALSPIVIKAKSRAHDHLLQSIEKDLEDAASQLSGTRPGIICIYLPDIDDLSMVRDSGVLERGAHSIFERRPERQVAEIWFVVDPVTKYGTRSLSTVYPVLSYANNAVVVGHL